MNTGIQSTEQGISESLVPVGDVGGSAGPFRPSACNRKAPSVPSQAVEQEKDTGLRNEEWKKEEEIQIFGKKPKVDRTPVKNKNDHIGKEKEEQISNAGENQTNTSMTPKSKMVSTPVLKKVAIFEKLTEEEKINDPEQSTCDVEMQKERTTKKRKAEYSPESIDWDRIECNEHLEKMTRKIEELAKFTRDNQNVHKAVKKISTELSGLIRKANKKEGKILSH
ncbi:hypothetical protein Zmor_003626 [Zophobas morio]|uniref:Uncharacterized protein n=1 Tax=Zophobas morio TaxID=2755281 RepID=A0AA38HSJ6_9CUCU|nr:hypothetical protein Zmor_003626 [Zophobas morio]